MTDDDLHRIMKAAHRTLIEEGLVQPVTLGTSEEQAWVDCDTACLAEHRLGDRTDPRELDDARRADWIKRATTEIPWPPSRRSSMEDCYWIIDRGERVGTIALSHNTSRGANIQVGSFYVYPDRRGAGIGRRVLLRGRQAFRSVGLGVRLDTAWCWQRSVRFYLGLGMLVRMWKRDVDFFWEEAPEAVMEIGERRAVIRCEGREICWAERDAERLTVFDSIPTEREDFEAVVRVDSTLSLALAMNGWPLLCDTKPEFGDRGEPGALAHRIQRWEAWERSKGWNVDAPRIPGLAYPTWDELVRQWRETG